jgi:hypothetical protein
MVTDFDAFKLEIDALEKLLNEIAAVIARSDDQRRFDLVKLRRGLSLRIGAIGRLADPLFRGTAEYQEYNARFSSMRAAAAEHQASWPAVLLGERGAEFHDSARPMREANREFIKWARRTLSQAGHDRRA